MRQRMKEKDETIEKQLQTIKSAQQEKKNSECRFHEISEHMKVKERKISVLQRKVCCAGTRLRSAFDNTHRLFDVTNNNYLLLLKFIIGRVLKDWWKSSDTLRCERTKCDVFDFFVTLL